MAASCNSPAGFWRAFFMAAGLAGAAAVAAPPQNSPPPLLRLGKVDQADGREALQSLRRLGISGDYFLEFQLRVMPRRGEERVIAGKLWGSRNENGPVSRVSLAVGKAAGETAERRLLIQNGPHPAAWRRDAAGRIEQLGVDLLFEPIVPEADMTAFDLMMPFIYWNDFTYEGLTRFRGRPAHIILLRPPPDFAARHPALKGVRVQLDAQFNALVQSELLGEHDVVMKTLSLVDLKKVGEQWIPRTLDLRDEATRNKTRFDVSAAALNQNFSAALFEPAQLGTDVAPPAGGAVQRFSP